jgi:integrase
MPNTIGGAFDLAKKDVWSQNKGDSSIRVAKRVMETLGPQTKVTDIVTSLIRELVEEWEDAGNTGGTVNSKLSALSVMLKCACDEGWLESMPRIKRRSPGVHRIRWLDVDEEIEVLNLCEKLGYDSLRDYVMFAIDTGFRRTEALEFKVKEYRQGMLHLHPEETKTSKARAVPATSRVHEIIEARRGNTRVFDDLTAPMLRDRWNHIRELLGKTDDPQFVVHMLRHTCASRLAMQDKTAKFIQDWMGHASPLTTARYMHLAPAKMREGAEALDAFRLARSPLLKAV